VSLLTETPDGLFCPIGNFHIDAWRPVDRDVVTHAHSDHLRWGMKRYLCSKESEPITRERLNPEATIDTLAYGEPIDINGVKLSLHPAGHVRGSAQVRLEHQGQVCVVTGDYKREDDSTCTGFELVRCHEFITESTFGLPIYRWKPQESIAADINAWWLGNIANGRTSVILGYTLGKSQRILSMLDPTIGPILLHGSMTRMTDRYREAGVNLPSAEHATPENAKLHKGKAIVIAPPSAHGSTWIRKFIPVSVASASGWMTVRGQRRRQAVDRGFILSDHVDWPGLLRTVAETGATRVGVTHGYTSVVARYLKERGLDAYTIATKWVGEGDESTNTGDTESRHPERSEGPGAEGAT
jgi:putative mRNA 3-end processing factor